MKKRHSPAQIVNKLRQADVDLGKDAFSPSTYDRSFQVVAADG
jgi:hypothetical protein